MEKSFKNKEIKIALAGNPNCGKTTMFNQLTGSAQYVGNWPGVTVEKKEGRLKGDKSVIIQDLPGIYSLSPYTPEEVVARNYLINEKPNAIINIIDGTNLERNLYLTLQIIEMGIPVVIALNMADILEKNKITIVAKNLSEQLGCKVIKTSALKGEGIFEAVQCAIDTHGEKLNKNYSYSDELMERVALIKKIITPNAETSQLEFYALKLFEGDEKIAAQLNLSNAAKNEINAIVQKYETICDDDAQSILANERYSSISKITKNCLFKRDSSKLSASDKIDKIVTNKWLALPIFAAVMVAIYFVAVTTIGTLVTDFTNDVLFGEWIIEPLRSVMENAGVVPWLTGLTVDGIMGGVGAVLGFVPQMLVLFLMLSILEDTGYMARVAFIMDRVFRKFGLSGKSFIPMLIGSGCSVPGIMASRTIENENDRKMTVMTTSFIPCGAKMPIVGLIAGALFANAWWVAPVAYFIGVAAVLVSGIILKKLKGFAGKPSPFVMELPAYHVPKASNVLRSTWDRGFSFIKRAGTVILACSVVIWFLGSFGFANGSFSMVEDIDASILAVIGGFIAPVFAPLGFGNWQATVATLMGLVAKEEVVGVMGVLHSIDVEAITGVGMAMGFTAVSAFSFLIFNLLCAPCFAAIGAIKKEMNSSKWLWFAIGYLTAFAYAIALIFFQTATFIQSGVFTLGTGVAVSLIAIILYMLLRKNKYENSIEIVSEAV